jgi:carbon-monoxide dehydrogenase small subunit
MFPPRFDYLAPRTVEEALDTLAERGEDAKVLAGGQSLIPLLKLRFAAPEVLVDINRVPGLDTLTEDDGWLWVGPLVRHRDAERSALLRERYPTMATAAPQISDPLVRNLGTVCGSLAHADPSGDWGAVMIAMGAELVARKRGGERTIPVRELFTGPFTTTLEPDELAAGVRVPARCAAPRPARRSSRRPPSWPPRPPRQAPTCAAPASTSATSSGPSPSAAFGTPRPWPPTREVRSRMLISVEVNGTERKADVEPRLLLVHFLREELGLTGTHIGCDTSGCGACTVLVDGVPVKSCTYLAVQADGRRVETVEGLMNGGTLHPIQEAFKQEHGLQCGFCTPGMMLTAKALLASNPDPSEEDVRWAISGNVCRCTGYMNIVKAVQAAAAAQSGSQT